MREIFVFGDSHTRALKEALSNRKVAKSIFNFKINWLQTEKNGLRRGDLKYEDAISHVSNLSENDLLVISLLGTGHNIFGLMEHDVPFRISIENDDLTDNINDELIPENLIFDMFFDYSNRSKKIIDLKKSTKAKVVHLMTPPPKSSNDYIKSKIKNYRDKVVGEYDINPPYVRLKFWSIEMNALQSVCKQYDIDVVSPPQEAIDSDGFLKEFFWGKDATHANSAYGDLVLTQLESLALTL